MHAQCFARTGAVCRRRLASNAAAAAAATADAESKLPADVVQLVEKYGKKDQTPASLQTLLRTGRGELLQRTYSEAERQDTAATELILMQVAGFLRRELPIRLAHRIQDLEEAPLLRDMPSVQAVRDVYVNSFLELIEQPKITCPEEEAAFAARLDSLYQAHSNVLIQMAKGAFELRAAVRNGAIKSTTGRKMKFDEMDQCHNFLDRFYMSRIGMRVLAGQYIALRQPPNENFIGMVCKATSPYDIVSNAVEDAKFMCDRKFGDSPDVIISGRKDLTFSYIPDHLHYILLELLKNALRATVETHGIDADYPPVEVIIADGNENEDVVIKVADEGGGIPRSVIKKIWSYLFTTADPSVQEGMVAFSGEVDHSVDSPARLLVWDTDCPFRDLTQDISAVTLA